MRRTALEEPRPAAGRTGAEVRLALVERVLDAEELAACAADAVTWLGRHAGLERTLLAVLDEDGERLIGAAGFGVTAEEVAAFSVHRADRSHPLASAVASSGPMHFARMRGRGGPSGSPLDPGPLSAIPIGGHAGGLRVAAGLLLVTATSRTALADALWVADLLGRRFTSRADDESRADGRRVRYRRRMLEILVNAVPDPVVLTDADGRIRLANARAEQLFAASDDASEGRRRAILMNNTFFSAALSRGAFEDAPIDRKEVLLVDPADGSDLYFELISAELRDPREGTAVVSILRDVTDLRQAMQELQDHVRRLRAAEAEARGERDRLNLIIGAAIDPILVTDLAGNIELMNEPAERLFTAREPAAEPEAERRVQANDARISSFVSGVLASGQRRARAEFTLLDPSTGTSVPVEAVTAQVFSSKDEVAAVVTILHDRSEAVERAILYEQLQRASEDLKVKVREATAELAAQNEVLRRQALALEQASAAKSQFLANMSHELRTPLNAILGYTSMLTQGVYGSVDEAKRRSLERVDANARHLLAIINDLLDIARIEAGRMPMAIEPTSIADVLTEVATELEPIFARSGLDVSVEASADLPAISTDRKKVKQIVVNLVANAVKFTPQGSVQVRASRDGDGLSIAVTDTGIGIAREHIERIFEDFRQVDPSPTRRYGGTGLGLAICRRLATMLAGRITVESRLGRGSTFALHLPIERSAA